MGEHFGSDDPAVGPRSGGTADHYDEESELDLDAVHTVLEHPRRRMLLDVVTDVEVVTMRDLATGIAARENDLPAHRVTPAQRRSVAVELHHVHVPKLLEEDVISVDPGMERVRPGPQASLVFAALRGMCAELDADEQVRSDAR